MQQKIFTQKCGVLKSRPWLNAAKLGDRQKLMESVFELTYKYIMGTHWVVIPIPTYTHKCVVVGGNPAVCTTCSYHNTSSFTSGASQCWDIRSFPPLPKEQLTTCFVEIHSAGLWSFDNHSIHCHIEFYTHVDTYFLIKLTGTKIT